MDKTEQEMKWMICPVCHGKTRLKLRKDTVIHNFLLYCPKCKQENLINVEDFSVKIITEPDAY